MGIALITNNILSDSGTAIAGLVPTSRTISTTAPLTGGGDLSADRTIAIPAATSSVNGYLTSADWTTFNNKQNALTNPVTGTGTGNYIVKWATGSTIGNSIIYDNGTNVGIGTTSANKKLEVITGNGITNGIRLTYAAGITTEGMDITYLNSGQTTTSFDSLYDSASAVMQFRMKTAGASPTTALSIFGSGNISVFSPTDSGYRFDVNGTGRFQGALTFPGGDRGLECAISGSLSIYNNEINSGSQGVDGALYFGWRRTTALNFGPVSVFSNSITAPYISLSQAGSATGITQNARFTNSTTSTANGSGVGFDFALTNSAGSGKQTGQIASVWSDNGVNATADLAFYTRLTGAGISEKLRITGDGYVGINTTTPAKLLTLYSSGNSLDTGTVIRLIGNTAPDLVDISVADTKTRIYHQENSADADAGYGIIQLRTNAAPNPSFRTRGGFQFTVGSTDVITISNTFTVGIGITPDAAKLSVQGVANEWALSVYSNTTTSQAYGGIIRGGTNSNDIAFRVNNAANSSTYFTVRGDGLGTINNMLSIASTSSIASPSSGKSIEMVYRTDGTNDYAFIQTYDRTNSVFKQLRISGNPLVLNGGGEGNVLIGTTTDAGYKLYVSGSAITVNSSTAEIRLQGGGYGTSYNTSLRSIAGSTGVLQFGNNGDNYILAGNTATGGNLQIRVNCSAESITSGTLAMVLSASAVVTFYGSVTAPAFYESSDKTIKTLIQDNYQTKGIESVVAKLYTKNGKEELGYFAQDVQEILPSAVGKGTDGLLSLSYREVHTAKIARLEKELEELKARLN